MGTGDTKRLEEILSTMDLPANNTDLSSDRNLCWLMRNMHIRNGEHKDIREAGILLRRFLKRRRNKQ